MSVRTDVLLWAQRVMARKTAPPYQILEIAPNADLDTAQDAFHKIAKLAHPDLHRTTLTEEELEQVTAAYSRAAAAYQEVRKHKTPSGKIQALKSETPTGKIQALKAEASTSPTGKMRALKPEASAASPTAPPANKKATSTVPPLNDEIAVNPAHAMTGKALIHYRKAELCLRRGELTTALLQLKMAIACDPQSSFLRTALSEVEVELKKP